MFLFILQCEICKIHAKRSQLSSVVSECSTGQGVLKSRSTQIFDTGNPCEEVLPDIEQYNKLVKLVNSQRHLRIISLDLTDFECIQYTLYQIKTYLTISNMEQNQY